jgi:hypothetical protein
LSGQLAPFRWKVSANEKAEISRNVLLSGSDLGYNTGKPLKLLTV